MDLPRGRALRGVRSCATGRPVGLLVAFGAGLLAALGAGLLAAPAAADEHDDDDRWCVPDPAGDTFVDDGEQQVTVDEPAADLRELCATHHDGSVTLSARLATAPDVTADPRWTEAESALLWFVDTTGDVDFDHGVELTVDDGALTVEVTDLRGDEPTVTCVHHGTVDGDWLRAPEVPAECVGAPGWLGVTAMSVLDRAPDDPDPATLVYDLADERVGVAPPGQPPRRAVGRLAGPDRFATAAAVARATFAEGVSTVYLARGDEFADALAAGGLAGRDPTRGPVLLVPSCGELPDVVGDVLGELLPSRVVALGGQAAVCDDVLDEAASRARGGGHRVAGPDRFATAAALSAEAFPDGAPVAYLATGEDFPDSLSAAALRDGPVLLTPSCGPLPDDVGDELDRLAPERVVAVGGQAAVCDEVLAGAAGAAAAEAGRLASDRHRDRFGTAAAVASAAFPDGAARTYLARADDFADALTVASVVDGPVLLTPSCGDLPPASARGVRGLQADEVVALGGQSAVCDQVRRHAANS